MSNSIFEEEGKKPAAGGMATAQQQIEKQARQLAYDTRYQVKKQIGDKAVPPAAMKRLLFQRLQKSTAAPNVKARAKQMLLGEDYIGDVADFAAGTVANAMFRVFVENKNIVEEKVSKSVEEAYLSEMEKRGGEKYKVRVTDLKTGNSYIRYATTEKITQLRLKGLRVEKTEHGSTREDEARRGAQTARALGGGGKAKRDYDGDGKVESGSKEHAGAVHNAIQRKKGGTPDGQDTRKDVKEAHKPGHKKGDGNLANNYPPYDKVTYGDVVAGRLGKDQKGGKAKVKEEFIADAAGEDSNTKKIDVLPKGRTNKVSVFPSDSTTDRQGTGAATPKNVYAHTELEGEVIVETGYSKFLKKVQNLREMSVSINQQQAAGAALGAKRGKTDPSKLKGAAREMYDSMTEKQLRDFAKTKHEGLPEKVKEAVEPRGGGSAPTLPAAEKFIDELPQKLQQIFGAKTKPTQKPSQPVKEEVQDKDTRADKTYREVIRNKFRALGDKKVMVLAQPEDAEKLYNKVATSDMIKGKDDQMCEGMGLSIAASKALGKVFSNPRTPESEATKAAQRNLTDPVGFAIKGAIRQAGENLGAGNTEMSTKRHPKTPLQKQVAARTQQVVNQSYEPEGEVIDERTRERKGQPRPARDRAMEIMRKMPSYRVGGMTRSGGTIAGHEEKRGVKKEPGAPTPTGETTADRLADRKKRAAAAQASVERAREEESRRRRLA